ncbi:pseudaminic acid synthase [Candidatus Woesearchaeota archaeon]|nr:pseudaminic acid synthase [Candidatus Woesearchaeota archaeon]
MPEFTIRTPSGERIIGSGHPAFIIAEMSSNHGQNFDTAVEIIKAAAKAGADAIKLQTYTPDTMTINCNTEHFIVGGKETPEGWKGQTLYELYQKAYTPWEWHVPLQKIAEELGLVFFSTPFDETAVDFLESLNVPIYKIASYEVTHLPLLKKVAHTGKPVIMSVGFATLDEIGLAVRILRENGTKDIALLHCVTAYSNEPNPENINLITMPDIQSRFNVVVGFSDNNHGIEIPLQAVLMGGSIIEKHMVLDTSKKTLDADFSINPYEFKNLVAAVRKSEKIQGVVKYGTQSSTEEHNKQYRRSIFAVCDIAKGEYFTEDNVKVIRPAAGLEPKYYEIILSKKSNQAISQGTPLGWDLLAD